ncbi:MAG: NAD-dependent epimerase [Betaproteobacteria bacterium]|nr:NAD-dependent epimerase [Betaproteobacteria bacterium]MSQ87899.1 NAD-dependent epimerase [Betaproteobacteria bacterium]
MRVLVTGAAGFIGMHACQRLLERGHEVFGIDNLNAYYDPALKRARLEQLRPFPGFAFEKLDIAAAPALATVFEPQRFDAVLHLAAQAGVRYSLENPMAYVNSNLAGFLNILEGCRKVKMAHLCYASSSSVYGANTELPFREEHRVDSPVSLYAVTKRANELMAHSYAELFGLASTGLRFFTVYGPWGRPDMALFLFTRAILEGQPIRVFNGGDMLRDFTYIDDIVDAVTALVEKPHPGAQGGSTARLFNIGHGSPVNLMDFVHAVENALGRKARIELAPMQPGDVQATYASTEKLRAEIGYAPATSIEVGVERFVAWYRSYYAGSDGFTA